MRLQAILASLMLLFAMGCPEDDDDSAGDDDASDDDAGDDDAGDDDAGDDDAASPWAGDHDGAFSGDTGGGLFAATVTDAGALSLEGETTRGEDVTGSGQIEDGGGAVISAEVAAQPKTILIDGTGDLRTEGGARLGTGNWTASDGSSGVWALWPPDFELDFTLQEIETGCDHSAKYCQSPVMTAQLCADITRCQAGFMAAHSTECLDVYNGFMQLFVDLDNAGDCPDFSQPLPGWVENDCPTVFDACGILIP